MVGPYLTCCTKPCVAAFSKSISSSWLISPAAHRSVTSRKISAPKVEKFRRVVVPNPRAREERAAAFRFDDVLVFLGIECWRLGAASASLIPTVSQKSE